MFAGSRGGLTRARIIRALMAEPANTNRLAEGLLLDYTTIQHHIKVLEQNGLIMGQGPKYGRTFFPTKKMEEAYPSFASIWQKLEQSEPKPSGESVNGEPV